MAPTCETDCDSDHGYCNINVCACNNGYTIGENGIQCDGMVWRHTNIFNHSGTGNLPAK